MARCACSAAIALGIGGGAGIAVEIEEFKLDGRILHIHALILVERDGQKKIIIGDKGERIKRIGQEARKDMESLFDNKVMLKVNRYETLVSNATLNSGGLGNVYLIGAGEAWGQAAAYQLSIDSGNWPGDGNYGTTSTGQILRWQPAGNGPYTQAEIDAQYAIQKASTDDWMANQLPASFQQAWGMSDYTNVIG